jgi:hypothetical protein
VQGLNKRIVKKYHFTKEDIELIDATDTTDSTDLKSVSTISETSNNVEAYGEEKAKASSKSVVSVESVAHWKPRPFAAVYQCSLSANLGKGL